MVSPQVFKKRCFISLSCFITKPRRCMTPMRGNNASFCNNIIKLVQDLKLVQPWWIFQFTMDKENLLRPTYLNQISTLCIYSILGVVLAEYIQTYSIWFRPSYCITRFWGGSATRRLRRGGVWWRPCLLGTSPGQQPVGVMAWLGTLCATLSYLPLCVMCILYCPAWQLSKTQSWDEYVSLCLFV